VQAEGVGAIGRASSEDAGERHFFVATRMHLKRAAAGVVEPSDEDQFLADGDAMKSFGELGSDVEPDVRSAFAALPGSIAAMFE